ncbi:NAD-dependent epimerase/dehydratase family protein [Verrucomicrobium spinosum]|uniref:NAD-dependent epimerase/dehydratase family protein n=1 Tax=Verrucomicrobium spinosum TaxID=2736 RepID=UPI00094685DE|nr:NAD(P)-dependent oxidoreductase [Verrucomicrobium spinosum]
MVEDRSPLAPLNPYASAKAETLRRLQKTAGERGVGWSWFRVFNAYGEGEAPARMITATMLKLAAGQPAVVKTPASLRDYVHVSDVALGMLLALEQPLTGAVNLGTGAGVTVYDLALGIAQAVGADPASCRRSILRLKTSCPWPSLRVPNSGPPAGSQRCP